MEQNRNVDFDSDVEIVSLKDAVWRLTTRVYLLEDFIAERFGEVICPSGFAKKTETLGSATSDPMSSTIKDSVCGNSISSSPIIRRRRKRDHAVICETEGQSQEIKKATEKERNIESDDGENIAILGLDFEQSDPHDAQTHDPLQILKDEVIHSDCEDDGDTNNYFLNERSDDDPNESLEEDPDFNPSVFLATDDNGSTEMQNRGHSDGDDSNQKSNLPTHMKIHRENKPKDPQIKKRRSTGGIRGFSCPICKKIFPRQKNLNAHNRIHTGEKPYVCTICRKGFSSSSILRTHCRIHTGEKPFCCSICYKSYSDPSNFKRHMKGHN